MRDFIEFGMEARFMFVATVMHGVGRLGVTLLVPCCLVGEDIGYTDRKVIIIPVDSWDFRMET